MPSALFEEYTQWEPHAKIELINGQLIVQKSLVHSRLLLSQILRGWGAEAAIALAPESLWWQALHQTCKAPMVSNLNGLEYSSLQAWAEQVDVEPEVPGLQSRWNRKRSKIRNRLYMAFFGLELRGEKMGRAIGGFVNRLSGHAFMPDILFFREQGLNCLYEYYLEGAAELVAEFVTPGCEEHDRHLKRACYQAASVPELWLVDTELEAIELLRLIDGVYQRQYPDEAGRYAIASLPGLTFIPANLWLPKETFVYPPESNLFEIAADAPTVGCIGSTSNGIDWSHAPTQFPIELKPTTIAFDDYLYWVPEPKFEFVEGKPDIGGREGIRGLTGMLLMTLGLSEAVKLLHPRSWVEALLRTRTAIQTDSQRKAEWWKLAQRAATLLREQFGATRIAVAGDLIIDTVPLNFWSELFIITWNLPGDSKTGLNVYRAMQNLSDVVKIYWFEADDTLSPLEQRAIGAGFIEI